MNALSKAWGDPGLRKVIGLTLSFKMMALATVVAGAFFLPFNAPNYLTNFHFPPDQTPDLWTRFKTWDAQHYLYLAQFGYRAFLPCNAFYPLYPFLIHWLGWFMGGQEMLAGFVLSTLFTMVATGLLFGLVRDQYDEAVAWDSCLFLLAFPTAFFMGFLYTESLFLLLSLGLFYAQRKGSGRWGHCLAFLLPLCRPTGLLLVLPTALWLYRSQAKGKSYGFYLLSFLLGFGVYLSWMKFSTGNWFEGFDALRYYWTPGGNGISAHPWDGFFRNFLDLHWTWTGPQTSFWDRVCFVGAISLFVACWRKLPIEWAVYGLALLLVSALSRDLVSFSRYLLGAFPIFVLLSIQLKGLKRYWLVLCVVLQVWAILLYSANEWVA